MREVGRRRRPLVLALVIAVLAVAGGLLAVGRAHPTQAATAEPTTSPSASPTGSTGPTRAIPSASTTPAATPGDERSASPGPSAVRVVALGDSVTAGTACGCTAFPDLYATGLHQRTGLSVQLDNRGEPGATTTDVLDDLGGGGGASVAKADVVVVTIGANDFADVADDVQDGRCGASLACAQDDLAALQTHLATLMTTIHQLRAGQPTAVLVTGYWNVYEDGDVADSDYTAAGKQASDALTRQVNALEQAAARAGAATYVDLYAPFKGDAGDKNPTDLLADDGDHPDADGHQVIAQALLKAGTAPLALAG